MAFCFSCTIQITQSDTGIKSAETGFLNQAGPSNRVANGAPIEIAVACGADNGIFETPGYLFLFSRLSTLWSPSIDNSSATKEPDRREIFERTDVKSSNFTSTEVGMVFTHVDAFQRVLAVVIEAPQLPRRLQHLRPGLDQLEQVSPRLVQPVLPLGNGSRVAVTQLDELVAQLVRLLDPFAADVLRVFGELLEAVAQHLCGTAENSTVILRWRSGNSEISS